MEYIGIDLHRDNFYAVIMDEKGGVKSSKRYSNSTESLGDLLALCSSTPSVVIEATRNWMWMVEFLQEKGCLVNLAHPLKTKAIASARIKTDTIDATTLAHLLRSDLVPGAYIPTLTEQDDREISRARVALTRQQTLLKNKIHAILAKENLIYPKADLLGQTGRVWLEQVPLREARKHILNEYLELLTTVAEHIKKIDSLIEEKSKGRRDIEILKTIPGIGKTTAFLLASEIGDVKRFESGRKLAAYLGLVPRVYQSSHTSHYGRITKLGNPYVRWSLVQAAHRLVRADENTRIYVAVLSKRAGKKKAIVAVARQIATIAWSLLTHDREYQKVPPNMKPTQASSDSIPEH